MSSMRCRRGCRLWRRKKRSKSPSPYSRLDRAGTRPARSSLWTTRVGTIRLSLPFASATEVVKTRLSTLRFGQVTKAVTARLSVPCEVLTKVGTIQQNVRCERVTLRVGTAQLIPVASWNRDGKLVLIWSTIWSTFDRLLLLTSMLPDRKYKYLNYNFRKSKYICGYHGVIILFFSGTYAGKIEFS